MFGLLAKSKCQNVSRKGKKTKKEKRKEKESLVSDIKNILLMSASALCILMACLDGGGKEE